MQATHILSQIPKHLQEKYNIGHSVHVTVNTKTCGGGFILTNNDGKTITLGVVHLVGTGVVVMPIR